MEQQLDFALFDRVRGRLRPTLRSLALFQEVERSFIGLESIASCAVALRNQNTGRLRLACLPALAHSLMPRALQYLQKTHPLLEINIQPLESPWLEKALSEQRFDLVLSETTVAPVGTSLRSLMQVNEVAVVPASHPLASKLTLSLQDFGNERFISLAPEDSYRVSIDRLFSKANIDRVMLLETASAVAVCAMVQQGLGVSIVNPLTALTMRSPKLKVRPLTSAIAFHVGILLPQIAAPHPLRSVLVDAIAKAARDMERELANEVP
jgi:DNA-binding transcriptional LysR family regulator